MEDVGPLTFDPFIFFQAVGFSIALLLLSYFQYKKVGQGIKDPVLKKKMGLRVLSFRYLAGLTMGIFDHLLMIISGFHPFFWPLAFWYVIVTYTTIVLIIPPNLNKKWRFWFILVWLALIIPLHSTAEIMTHYIFNIPYPIGWTELTTFIFYIDVHLFGTFIAVLHWDSRFTIHSVVKNN